VPTYDYKCKECGHEFEYFQSMSAENLKECPECKGEIRRLISGGTGLIFKGSGFYSTDYAPKRPIKSKKSETKNKTSKKIDKSIEKGNKNATK